MPLLSIITINLNNALGLLNTIISVLSQTFNDYEYIIIDGGSTDGSIDVIDKYRNRLSYWVSEPDCGIYEAMNKGLSKTNGHYCQFINSGDIIANNLVYEKISLLGRKNEIIIGNMMKIWPNKRIIRDKGIGNEELTFYNLYKGTINHSSAFIPRSYFLKYGLYDESLKIVSDWKWYLIVIGIHNEGIHYIDEDISIFEMTGISNSQIELHKAERRQVLKELLPINILRDYDTIFSKELLSNSARVLNLLIKLKKKILL